MKDDLLLGEGEILEDVKNILGKHPVHRVLGWRR